MTTERLEIKIGAAVEASDGPLGHVRQVVLNPGDKRVSALVVRHGTILGKALLIPIENVAHASDHQIRLQLSSREAMAQPAFCVDDYIAPTQPIGGYTIAQGLFSRLGRKRGAGHANAGAADHAAIVIRAGQRVECADGEAGKVDLVLLDGETKRATHFVIHKGALRAKDVIVPVEWISESHADSIKLGVVCAQLEHLPEYRSDRELQRASERALEADENIRLGVLPQQAVHVDVRDGVVTVHGNVTSDGDRLLLKRAIEAVPGVQAVQMDVVLDYELEIAVAQALARDARTRPCYVRVHAWLGTVELLGNAPDAQVRDLAAEIAARVHGVRSIVNLIATPDNPTPQPARLITARVGQLVYAEDMDIGRVEKVVISPRSRCVTALIVRGRVPDLARADSQLLPAEWPKMPRTFVVPIECVQNAAGESVSLNLTGVQAARLPDFDPAAYITPAADWTPPVPYHREEVLLDLGRKRATDATLVVAERGLVRTKADETPSVKDPLRLLSAIERGQRVTYRDGMLGIVDLVLVEPQTQRGIYLVVRNGGPLSKPTQIPIEWVGRVEPDHIFVDVGAEQLRALPEYEGKREAA